MRKTIQFLAICIISITSASAQSNKVDLGLTGLINRNLNFSYERKLSDKFSVKSGLGYMLPGKLPWLDYSKEFLNDNETEGYLVVALNNLRISAISITPEIRFFPKGNALKGLYLGPYAKYADYMFNSSYTSDVDYTDNGLPFTKKDVVFDLSGHIRKAGAGIVIGYQWIASETISFDLCLFGPGLVYAFATSTVDSPEFPSSRDIGEFTQEELSVIPNVLGTIEVEQTSRISAKGTWNQILPICRFNLSIGIAF
ncbi:MAG: hypothetical protein CVU05_04975 [Bacteroidetes bacterium HGW-Bacteroidetes-21]|jgi:hypothetical protein|nr:MAG: hypothetical protein CVU05_04975 [Bacteroidetes bacterium HGW-Bacteroidetes-21]